MKKSKMAEKLKKDGYILFKQENGKTLGISENSKVKIIEKDGLLFKDFLGTGELVDYEDWRLSPKKRAADLASRLSDEDIAGLMLYSAHQVIPATGSLADSFGGTYHGKTFEDSGAEPWELTDQQKQFILQDKIRHVLVMKLESTETAVRWNNNIQALAENNGFGIPVNNSSDPRHTAGNTAEYMGVTGEPISKWANGIGLTAAFEPEQVKEFGRIAAKEYRALGITTALSPQIDLATEPRWMRFADTFGENTELTVEMARAYCDGFQTTPGSSDGWGEYSVNAMVKHFPGGGTCEGGRDAHYSYGKYAVYPGNNFEEHLKPFTEGAFQLKDGTKTASAVMPYYTISWNTDVKNHENVGNSYSSYLIQDLLRNKMGYDGVVCTDWGITHDEGEEVEVFAGKCWGVETLNEVERHMKALEAGVDQFGGNNDAGPLIEAFRRERKYFGETAWRARIEQSAVRLLINIFQTGLFENPYLDLKESAEIVGCPEFVKKGYESQLKSITLLKNKDNVLPLKKGKKVYIPNRHIRPYLDFMSHLTKDRYFVPEGKKAAAEYYEITEEAKEADFALCFIESPISVGYNPDDRKNGGNGYVPITLQYRPYQAVTANATSLAGGDPLEKFNNRSYVGKWNTAANEADLDAVINARKKMKDKPVIVCVTAKNPMVMSEVEPYADAIVMEYGVCPKAVLDIVSGIYEPTGLLPMQLPANMDTVEKQKEDVPFDMECYKDSEGNVYQFGFGLNFKGVIKDNRTKKYAYTK